MVDDSTKSCKILNGGNFVSCLVRCERLNLSILKYDKVLVYLPVLPFGWIPGSWPALFFSSLTS